MSLYSLRCYQRSCLNLVVDKGLCGAYTVYVLELLYYLAFKENWYSPELSSPSSRTVYFKRCDRICFFSLTTTEHCDSYILKFKSDSCYICAHHNELLHNYVFWTELAWPTDPLLFISLKLTKTRMGRQWRWYFAFQDLADSQAWYTRIVIHISCVTLRRINFDRQDLSIVREAPQE